MVYFAAATVEYSSFLEGSERLACFVLLSVPLSAPSRLQALFTVDSASISWQKPLSDQGHNSSLCLY